VKALAKISRCQKRMGCKFPWLSSFGNDFNHDFQVTIDGSHSGNNYRPAYHKPDLEWKGPTEEVAPGSVSSSAKTFWSPCFGMLADRFGIGWMASVVTEAS
jgi:predicted dithiol-disulfide oxidoreductase (DUF899 family)